MKKAFYLLGLSSCLLSNISIAEPYVGAGYQTLRSHLLDSNTDGFYAKGGYDFGVVFVDLSTGKATSDKEYSHVDKHGNIHMKMDNPEIKFADLGIGHRFELGSFFVSPRLAFAAVEQNNNKDNAIEYGISTGYNITKNFTIEGGYKRFAGLNYNGNPANTDGFDIGISFHF